MNLPDRILNKIVFDTNGPGCWIWSGSRNRKGYGTSNNRHGSNYVHRQVFELLVGPIPPGYVIDHLCRNPACCNPDHLDPCTNRENLDRGRQREVAREMCRQRNKTLSAERAARRTACPQGHPYAAGNIYMDGTSVSAGRAFWSG